MVLHADISNSHFNQTIRLTLSTVCLPKARIEEAAFGG
jgi:hypothetical protein